MLAPPRRRLLPAAIIVVLTAATYAPSLDGGFVSDDVVAVVENPLLDSLAPAKLRAIATSFDDANYIPLKVLSLAVDRQLWGPEPTGHHVTNVALHAANALLVHALLLRLGEPAGAALAVGLLWALHPVQVESVAWISERKNVLSTCFFLLAFAAWLRLAERPAAGRYLVLLVLFAAALLSKVNTIVLPALMLAHAFVFRRRVRVVDVGVALSLLAVGAVVAWVNLAGNPSHGAAYHGGSLAVTLRTSATVVPRYLVAAVYPLHLSTVYDVPLRGSWFDPAVLLGSATVLGLAAATIVLGLRRRPEAFWVFWFGVTLSPMLNLVPFPALIADRYLYIPLVGILVLVARGARGRAAAWLPARAVLPAAAGLAVAACVVLTLGRIPVWHDELSLWADGALRSHYIAADQPYGPAPRPERHAILAAARAARPDDAALLNNMGALAFEESRLDEARAALEQARRLDADDPTIALNLGRVYLHGGRIDAAVATLEAAAALEPPSFFAHLNLARARRLLGDRDGARAALRRAQEIRPDPYHWMAEARLLAPPGTAPPRRTPPRRGRSDRRRVPP